MQFCKYPGNWVLAGATIVALLGLIISIIDNAVVIPTSWTSNITPIDYGIVVDAGSHGTRAHLFRWAGKIENPDGNQKSAVTIPEEVTVCERGVPGLSTFAYTPKQVGPVALAPLIACLNAELDTLKVAPRRRSTIPLFLKATAGLRLMDLDQRDMLMLNIREYLGNSTVATFLCRPNWVRVISGEEEGVFGWMTVNQGLHTLLKSANATVGALDLGGASAQITFSPLHTSVMEDFYELNLNERPVRLYSHSFLSYGWGDANLRLTTRLALETVFNVLNMDKRIQNGSVDPASEVIAGKLPGIIVKPIESQATTHKNPSPSAGTPKYSAEIAANHPCYPKGYSFTFAIPSLIYPDGRSFIDLDLRAILAYIEATGVSLDSPALKKVFPLAAFDLSNVISTTYLPGSGGVFQSGSNSSEKSHVTYFMEEIGVTNTSQKMAISEEEIVPFQPPSVPLPVGRLQYLISFQGSSDFEACQQRAKDLFYQEPCFLHTCSFNGVYQPRIAESRFIALGQFAKVQRALALPNTATPNSLERSAAGVCTMTHEELMNRHKNGEFAPFGKKGVINLCWKSLWAHTLLTRGYGFDGESHNVQFAPIDQPVLATGWALGSMIFEISYLPWIVGRLRYKGPFYWAMAAVLALMCSVTSVVCRLLNTRTEKKELMRELIAQHDTAYHRLDA